MEISQLPCPALRFPTRRKTEQLQGARQGPIEPVGPLCLPRSDGTVDLSPHIGELLDERKRCPASSCKSDVDRHPSPQPSTSTPTIRRIRSRSVLSSTFLDRFP